MHQQIHPMCVFGYCYHNGNCQKHFSCCKVARRILTKELTPILRISEHFTVKNSVNNLTLLLTPSWKHLINMLMC